jgi:hypothetical protein
MKPARLRLALDQRDADALRRIAGGKQDAAVDRVGGRHGEDQIGHLTATRML